MVNRNYNKSERTIKVKRVIYILIAVILVLLLFLDINIRPVIKKVANYQGKVITTKFVDEAIVATLDSGSIDYDDIITVSRNSENEIVGVETNMQNINRIKSTLSQSINQNFTNLTSYDYRIPLGTLINSDYLVGRGPEINFKISPSGFVKSNFISKFSSVGINQTLHQIMINVEVEICTILPFHKNTSTLTTDYLVAETVIVGKVPSSYINLFPSSGNVSDDINSYVINENSSKKASQ